jgi:HlyD family secretion protein
MKAVSRLFNKKVSLVIGAVLLVLFASGFVYYRWQAGQNGSAVTYQTTAVKRGDLSLVLSGTGKLVTSATVNLNFPVSGTVDKVNVGVGDQVKAGDVLATLAEIDQLSLKVQIAQANLLSSQKALADLQQNGADTVAQAKLALANAQQNDDEANKKLLTKYSPRCDANQTKKYYFDYIDVLWRVNQWESILANGSGYGTDYVLHILNPMLDQMNKALMNYQYCQSYTSQEILASQATLKLADATLSAAKTNYQKQLDSNGIDPVSLALAQAKVQNDETQLASAQSTLKGATIVAPIDATVTKVNGATQEKVDTSTFITLVDYQHPQVDILIDEGDAVNFTTDCSAAISFDAISGRTYQGTIAQIFPTMSTTKGYSMVEGLVSLTNWMVNPNTPLHLGMNATVDLTCGQAKNVLYVPTPALHKTSDGHYQVYILNAQGVAVQRQVEVGLKTISYAEIRSGLQGNEKVITNYEGLQ